MDVSSILTITVIKKKRIEYLSDNGRERRSGWEMLPRNSSDYSFDSEGFLKAIRVKDSKKHHCWCIIYDVVHKEEEIA